MKLHLGAFLLAFSVAATGCQSRWPEQRSTALPDPAAGGRNLEGGYRWVSINGKSAPQEFPVGSGTMLVYGTLDLRDVAAAQAGTGGRYGMRFTVQPRADTARVTGNDGRLVIRSDSLIFTPDGRENEPPVRFRYSWRSNGQLALTDASNHVWVYVRR